MHKIIFKLSVAAVAIVIVLGAAKIGTAQEPGWDSRVIVPREERSALQATPIEQRPYRPLHFYGNTIRRNYYHGTPIPLPRGNRSGGDILANRSRLPARTNRGR